MKSIPLLVLAGLGYLAFALAMNIVIRVYLVRDLWVRVLGSVNDHRHRGCRQRCRAG